MRLLLPALLILFPFALSAQELQEAPPVQPSTSPIDVRDGDQAFLTHSLDMTVTTGGVACFYQSNGTQTGTQENNYWRVFDLLEFGIQGDFEISAVLHGVATTTAPNEQTFFFYSLDGDFDWPNLELLDDFSFIADPDDEGKVLTFNLDQTITVPAGGTLAVQIHIPDSDNNYFALAGMNQSGETGSTYIHSDDCGLASPVAMEDINPDWADIAWVLTVVGKDTAISTEGEAGQRVVHLGSAYPNPSAGHTILPIELETSQHVRIAIHDVLGREVAVVADELMQAGPQSINVTTANLAAGTYIVRMQAGADVLSSRLVVVR